MEISPTQHAARRMWERGITVEEAKKVISRGMKWFVKAEGESGRWHAKMGNIEVVFEKYEDRTVIVTAYRGG